MQLTSPPGFVLKIAAANEPHGTGAVHGVALKMAPSDRLCETQVVRTWAPSEAGMLKAITIAATAMLDANLRMVGHFL
jgi:hypothetical protein